MAFKNTTQTITQSFILMSTATNYCMSFIVHHETLENLVPSYQILNDPFEMVANSLIIE